VLVEKQTCWLSA